MTIILTKLKCLRCGHEWFPRSETPPLVCPNSNCKSRYWDTPRKVKTP